MLGFISGLWARIDTAKELIAAYPFAAAIVALMFLFVVIKTRAVIKWVIIIACLLIIFPFLVPVVLLILAVDAVKDEPAEFVTATAVTATIVSWILLALLVIKMNSASVITAKEAYAIGHIKEVLVFALASTGFSLFMCYMNGGNSQEN